MYVQDEEDSAKGETDLPLIDLSRLRCCVDELNVAEVP